MKKLILIRHAKSDWNSPSGDSGRPLAKRGVSEATNMANTAKTALPKNFVIWCSTAKRTIQTATIFTEIISYPFEDIIFKEELYTFDMKSLEYSIKSCDNLHDCLIVFCHNEAITDFVNKFGDICIDNVPTSGFVTISFDTNDWQTIQNGQTGNIIFPSDLTS